MKILYYTWNENSQIDMLDALSYMGHEVIKCEIPFLDYNVDAAFTHNLEKVFNKNKCDIFLSFDFFPLIAKSAERLKKKYISWVYDMPHGTLFSPSIRSEYVYLYIFDREQYKQIKELGAKNIFHLPLAVNTRRLNKKLGELGENIVYQQDVSFVGSLYEDNMFRKIQYLPEYLKGYLEGVIKAQMEIAGYNLVNEVLTEEVVSQLCKIVKLNLNKTYLWNDKQIYTDMINAEITHRERIRLLKSVNELFDFKLFTGSVTKDFSKKVLGGTVSYDTQMPMVFRRSKINLNITLRSITSGIPLRALDIMGAGGFLLSNYQPELAENFVDGEEMVMFYNDEDMLYKIAYYLEHEEERKQIAYNGWRKVQKEFSYENQLKKILLS